MILLSEQAPCRFAGDAPPTASMGTVGTRVTSRRTVIGPQTFATNPRTGKPIYPPPVSAGPIDDHVSTTSLQSGDHPNPIPPIGTVSPQANSPVASADDAAPQTASSSWGLGIFVGAIVLLLFFAGASFRRFL